MILLVRLLLMEGTSNKLIFSSCFNSIIGHFFNRNKCFFWIKLFLRNLIGIFRIEIHNLLLSYIIWLSYSLSGPTNEICLLSLGNLLSKLLLDTFFIIYNILFAYYRLISWSFLTNKFTTTFADIIVRFIFFTCPGNVNWIMAFRVGRRTVLGSHSWLDLLGDREICMVLYYCFLCLWFCKIIWSRYQSHLRFWILTLSEGSTRKRWLLLRLLDPWIFTLLYGGVDRHWHLLLLHVRFACHRHRTTLRCLWIFWWKSAVTKCAGWRRIWTHAISYLN